VTSDRDMRARTIHVVEDRFATLRHAVEAVAIVLAGAWAIYTFVYQERLKPTWEHPSAEFKLRVDPGHVTNGTRLADVTLTMTNTGHNEVGVFAEVVNVYGRRFARNRALRLREHRVRGGYELDGTTPSAETTLLYVHALLRGEARGGDPQRHVHLAPGSTFVYDFPIAVPEGRFDALEAAVHIGYTRDQRTGAIGVKIERDRDGAARLQGDRRGPGFTDMGVIAGL
jgi:hypothetical protein